MAIDFGRMFQGVATGAMGQYNAEVAAKDKMKGEMIERAGLNFYENTLPAFEKKEKSRKETYDKLSQRFGPDVAEYFGQNFITGDANDYKNILIQLGDNPDIKADKLKQYLKATDSSYTKRATKRFDAIKEREKVIMGLTTGDSKIGDMTAQLQIPESTPMTETTEEVITPAIEGSQSGPVVTEAVPEKREMKTTALPTYEEIFSKDEDKLQTDFSAMPYEDKTRIIDDARQEYQTTYGFDKLTGAPKIPEEYETKYNELKKDNKVGNKTIEAYAYDRFFKEQYLPKVQIGYNEPYAVTTARRAINHQRSINNEAGVQQAKEILKSMGFDPNDYGL